MNKILIPREIQETKFEFVDNKKKKNNKECNLFE